MSLDYEQGVTWLVIGRAAARYRGGTRVAPPGPEVNMSVTEKPKSPKTNTGHVPSSSSAPPDLPAPTPGAGVDEADGIPSGRGRATALTDEVPTRKP